ETPRLPPSHQGSGIPRDARDRLDAVGQRAHGTPPVGGRPRGARRGLARGERERGSRHRRPGPPRRGRVRGEPGRPRAGRGLPPRRPRTVPSEGRPRLPPRPRLGVPEPRDPLRQYGPARPGLRYVHEGPRRPRSRRGLGWRRRCLGGPGPVAPRDPRRGPMAGGSGRGDRLLRPRGTEGEGGPTADAARQEKRVTWAFHPTLQMPRATLADDLMALTIDVQQLWKSYEGKPALQGLFLDARAGEIVGLIGPNGAGKTTTLKILVGLLRPDYGVVRVKDHDVLADPVSYKADIGYMPEPLIGSDPAGQHLLKDRLTGIAHSGGTGLVSTHQLDTAERLCDRVAIVNPGRNVATGSLESLRASVDTGERASLEEIFLRLTQEATVPEVEAPRRRGWFRRG